MTQGRAFNANGPARQHRLDVAGSARQHRLGVAGSARQHRLALGAVALLAVLALSGGAARAETAEVRIARQFSMGYLQFNVMEHQALIEKHARALGLTDVKVSWITLNGPNVMNDALISGSIDIVAGGVPGLLTLWAKTKGTPQEVRGISALSSQPFLLNTRNPAVKTVADFTPNDRIALPAVKVSVQAVVLQMAAAKQFGAANFGRLDSLAVSMSPPDATIALLSRAGDITAVFSVPPFQQQQLDSPGIHTVLNSFDVMDGPHTFTVTWTSARFRERNPAVYKAVLAALEEATATVNQDRRAAAAYWIGDSKSKLPLDTAARVVSGPQVRWTQVPENTMKFAQFMHEVGTLPATPASWRDYFFPEIHHLRGS